MPSTEHPEVVVADGRLRGQWTDAGAVFRGVPFAAPPFGARRFRPPQPAERWDGVRDATAFGPGCPQLSLDPDPRRSGFFNPVVTGEDCLNLNVWTPAPGRAGLPVMVWIHGGGYMTGGGSAPAHDGSTWARDGIVYVSINYRMHVEGFLYFGDETANLGLLDQVAALRWVRDNIAAFGGDPDNVTIFGQSAGGVSVMHLLAMPAARGLFRRAIVQSGSTLVTAPDSFATRVTERMAALLDVAPTRDAFRDLPVDRVVAAVVAMAFEYISPVFWGRDAFLVSAFRPVIDGTVLTTNVDASVAGGSADGVDVMGGCTGDEATFAMDPFGLLTDLPEFWRTAALDAFEIGMDDLAVYERSVRPATEPAHQLQRAWTDWAFRMPTIRLLDAHAARPGRTYAYEFTWPSPTFPRLGSVHALEIPFVNDALDAFVKGQPDGENPIGDDPPQHLATEMHRAWVAFAAAGDPGWPEFGRGRKAMMFDVASGVVDDWAAPERDVWLSRP